MSTESGLPDFRSAKTGMWSGINPLQLASVDAMENNRKEFIKFYTKRIHDLLEVKPHVGHEILAKWEQNGIIQSIITQNVDGFHQAAGSKNVAELHGSLRKCHCNTCKKVYSYEDFYNGHHTCDCGGFIRPSVVLFGENLNEEVLLKAEVESNQADLFIVLGSSLSVSPANWFPLSAKRNNANLVIVNNDPTEYDEYADLVINNQKIGEVLGGIDKEL